MVSVRDFGADWRQAIARAAFHCAECGAVAARVALVPDEPAPGHAAGKASTLITQADFFGEWAQLVLAGGCSLP